MHIIFSGIVNRIRKDDRPRRMKLTKRRRLGVNQKLVLVGIGACVLNNPHSVTDKLVKVRRVRTLLRCTADNLPPRRSIDSLINFGELTEVIALFYEEDGRRSGHIHLQPDVQLSFVDILSYRPKQCPQSLPCNTDNTPALFK